MDQYGNANQSDAIASVVTTMWTLLLLRIVDEALLSQVDTVRLQDKQLSVLVSCSQPVDEWKEKTYCTDFR